MTDRDASPASGQRRQRKVASSHGRQGDCEAILHNAALAHREGRLGDAETGYREVLRQNPEWGAVLNALGTVFLDQARPEKARKVLEKAAALQPPYVPASYNLAMLKQQEGDHPGAVSIYRTIVARQPDFGHAWNNMGVAYREIGEPDEALACFQKAVTLVPDMAEAWNNLGVAQDELNMTEAASASYRKATEIRPDYPSAHFNLGVSLQKLGRLAEADAHYGKVLERKPDDPAAQFMRQSLGTSVTPDAAPVEHVRRIFDQCAGTFERILVKDLAYRTPELLFGLVRPYLRKGMRVLDLGCGTGLGAAYYRPFAERLIGVDISSKMLAKAAVKGVYDRLVVLDILQDWGLSQPVDLIYSSDVLVYVGKLDPVIRSASSYLVDGGLMALSVERLQDPNLTYRLFPSGRYAHSEAYVAHCLRRHGFQVVAQSEEDIRKQSGHPVRGLLMVGQKKTGPVPGP